MYGYIYKFTFIPTLDWYVGKHKYLKCLDLDPNYWGSGIEWKKLISQYDKKDWPNLIKREIIEWCETLEELNEREIYWVAKLDAINEGLNISPGGDGGNTYTNLSQEEKELLANKRSNSMKIAIDIYNSEHDIKWGKWESAPWSEESKLKASISAKNRGYNSKWRQFTKCIIIVKLDGTQANKCIPESEYQKYKADGWVSKKDLKNMNKVQKKVGGYNSGSICVITPEGRRKYIKKEELDYYISIGCIKKEKRDKHNEKTIQNMKHSHKKMQDTSNVGLGNLKWLYIFDGIKYTGGKLLAHLRSLGYNISRSGIDGIVNNSIKSCIKFPDLVGKISKIEAGD